MSVLDDLHGQMQGGHEAAGLAFYRALADAELFVLLEEEAQGEVMRPRVFDTEDGPVLLAFDSEERLAGFSDQILPYAALPGRVIAGQMAGQGLALGLNLGTGAASEVILPPEALDWLLAMLDQAPPEAVEGRVTRFEPPRIPLPVLDSLAGALAQVGQAQVVGAVHGDGRRGQMLVLTGVTEAAKPRVLRAVTEALVFSGLDASALDTVFLEAGDPALARLAGVALVLEGEAPPAPPATAPQAPGMDPLRPPILK